MGLSTLRDELESHHYIGFWVKFFAIIPRRSMSGKLIWFEIAYKRPYVSLAGDGVAYLKKSEVDLLKG